MMLKLRNWLNLLQVQVKPRCGRLVSFSAGKECLHGVKPVTRGRRCAMALWFTLDPNYDEVVRVSIQHLQLSGYFLEKMLTSCYIG